MWLTTLSARIRDARWVLLAAAMSLFVLSVSLGGVNALPMLLGTLAWLAIALVAVFVPRRSRMKRKRINLLAAAKKHHPGEGVEALASAFAEPIYILTPDGNLAYANDAANATFGLARIGAPLLFKFRQPEISQIVDLALQDQKLVRGTYIERHPTEKAFAVSITPVFMSGNMPEPRSDGAQGSKTLKASAKFFALRFEDRSELRATQTMRADFVANASHELRTPLSSLSGIIETLRGPAKNDEAAREKFLLVMQDQTERMIRLVDDLLSLSRVEMNLHKTPTETVHLNEVLTHVADAMLPLALDAKVELNLQLDERDYYIQGARDELVQVFENLADNAIKYGRSGGKIDIKLVREDDDEVYPLCVKIRDYGDGIDPIHIKRLPERFYRADIEASKKQKGTGLGLSIVKRILNRHKARLEIVSALGEGSTFSARFSTDTIIENI